MIIPYQYQEIEQLYSKTVGKGVRTIAVLSSIAEEGTSSVVCALAQRATAVNKKVLVVDLNLHNPFVSAQIEQPNTEQPNLPQTIQPTSGPSLNVLPVPIDDKNQMKMREQNMFSTMTEQWLEQYDLIIFDTSPLCQVNRKNIPPQIVASCSDAAVLVVRSGKTQQRQLSEAMTILNSLNVNLLGTVVNDYTNPSLGIELVRQCCKMGKMFPRFADWLIGKINTSPFLFARF